MDGYEIIKSEIIEGNIHVSKQVKVHVLNTLSNNHHYIRVRPKALSDIVMAEGGKGMSDQELLEKAEAFVRSNLENEEFVHEIKATDSYSIALPVNFQG